MAKMKEFSTSQKEDILKQALAFWEQSTRMMQPLFDQVNDFERAWRVQLPKDLQAKFEDITDRAALAPPDFYINIKSLRATLRTIVFGSKPFAQLSLEGQPNLRNDQITKAEHLLQSLLDMQNGGRGFESEADKVFHQAIYAGITGAFTRWKRKSRPIPQRWEDTGEVIIDPKGRPVIINEIVAAYPETIAIAIRRMRIDPSAESRDDIRIVGYHYIAKLSDLLVKNRDPDSHYEFDEQKATRSSFPRAQYFEHIEGEHDTYTEKAEDNVDFSDKNIEVLELRGLFRFADRKGNLSFQDLVVQIANREFLLGAKINDLPIPGWEMFDFPGIDQETSRLFTMGVIEPLFDTWIEKFIKRNQSLDEASRRTYDIYIGDKSACQDLPDVLERIPDQIYTVDLMASGAQKVDDVLKPLERQSSGHDTFVQAESLTGDLQKGAGVNDYTQGIDPQRKETATAVSELVAGGRAITEQIAKHLKDTFLAPAWRKHLILWDFFNGHQSQIIYDQQGQNHQIEPGDIGAVYNIEIDIATSMERPALQRRMVEILPVIMNDPFYDPYEVRRTANEVLSLPNAQRLMVPNEHLMTIILRENLAMGAGVPQPVSPFDNHNKHIQGHMEYAQQMAASSGGQLHPQIEQLFMAHLQEHQFYIEQMSAGLGNTKEMGGNAGRMVEPEGASMKSQGLKQENRP